MILYLAGPMTGWPDHNYPAFRAVAQLLREAGFRVSSPHEAAEPGHTWGHYVRQGLRLLLDCEALVLLPGWRGSKGATLEHRVAKALGMPIYEWVDGRLQELP